MTKFLVRDTSDPKGYKVVDRPDGTLPRTATESYVPWMITNVLDGEVIYAKHGEHRTYRMGGTAQGGAVLRPYDTEMSQRRRQRAETDLGLYALHLPHLTQQAVFNVSRGIRAYLVGLYVQQKSNFLTAVKDNIGSYFYTGGRKGFGRISEADHTTMTAEQIRLGIMNALTHGSLDQKMSIHDAVGRKILPIFGGQGLDVYNRWGPILRGDWFEKSHIRGRANVAGSRATKVGGVVASRMEAFVGKTGMERNRGVDMFQRDLGRHSHKEANAYYDDLDDRNLTFGAGISGTTGSLLQSAFAFGEGIGGDLLKQYVLAIVGYLVGGGMHSYHESMAVAQKASVPYTPGLFLPSLPQTFLTSPQCREWKERYYDIVTLGATHWRHSAPHLPSHLNRNLGTTPLPKPR